MTGMYIRVRNFGANAAEVAAGLLRKNMRSSGILFQMRERRFHKKPSQVKYETRKKLEYRLAKNEVRKEISGILSQKARGF